MANVMIWRAAIGAIILMAVNVASIAPVAAIIQEVNGRSVADQARMLMEQGDYQSALKLLLDGVNRVDDADKADYYLLVSRAYLETGAGVAAETAIERARAVGADHARTALPHAKSLLIQGRFGAALSSLQGLALPEDISADALIVQGDAYFGLKRLPEAQRHYEEAKRLRPKSYAPYLGLARLALARNDLETAEQYAEEADKRQPDQTMVVYTQGLLAKAAGQTGEAKALFERAVSLYGGHQAAYLELAFIAIDEGREEQAERYLDQVYAAVPNHPVAQYLSGVLAARRGDFEAARTLFLRARHVVDRYLPGLYIRGLVALELDDLVQANSDLAKVFGLRPDYAPARLAYAATLLKSGRARDARALVLPLIEMEMPQAYQVGASAAAAMGRVEESAEWLKAAASAETGVEADKLAFLAFALGRAEDALTQLTGPTSVSAGETGSQSADLRQLALFASMQIKSKDHSGAKKTAQRLLDLAPARALSHNIMGTALMGLGEREAALVSFDQALALRADYNTARRNRSIIYLEQDNYAAAAEDLETVLRQAPNDLRAKALLGRVFLEQGQARKALPYLSEVARSLPGSIEAAIDHAKALSFSGQEDVGRAEIRRILPVASQEPQHLKSIAGVMMSMGDYAAASRVAGRYVAYRGEDVDAYLLWGQAQMQAGLHAGARRIFERAQTLPGADDRLLDWYIFVTEARSGQKAAAAERFDRLDVGARPQTISGAMVGDLLRLIGRSNAAVAYLERLPGEDMERDLALARAYEAVGQSSRAIEILAPYGTKHNLPRGVRGYLADLYYDAEQYEEARDQYKLLIDRRLFDARIARKLADVYLALGQKESIQMAELAHRLLPRDPEVLDTYGWVLLQSERDVNGAIKTLEEAVSRGPGRASARYHLGMAYVAAGRRAEAIRALSQAVQLGARTDVADDAQKQLDLMGAG